LSCFKFYWTKVSHLDTGAIFKLVAIFVIAVFFTFHLKN
jgi:hypothetical protein